MLREILIMSAKSMKENSLRSTLTTLGIVIGTAIIIVVLSVGSGIEALILSQLSFITPETVYVEIQVPSNAKGREKDTNTGQSIGQGVQIKTMKLKDIEDIKKIPNVEFAYGMIIAQANLQSGSNEKTALIWGVGDEHIKVENFEMAEGRFYNQKETKNYEKVIVIGSTIKEKLFGNSLATGKKIKIKNQSYQIVGVVAELGSQYFLNMDEVGYIPVTTVQRHILGIDYIQAISIKLKDRNQIIPSIKAIYKVMRTNHDITDPDKDDFAIRTLEESMQIIASVTSGISILLFCLAAISIVVGGVGIMNVMYVSVTERTKEIGLKKAIGAKPFLIKFQFLSEAVVLCAIGGGIGVIVGIGITWFISFIAGLFDFDWPFIIKLSPIVLAFSVSVFSGILFGYAPAQKAANLDPVVAMRK